MITGGLGLDSMLGGKGNDAIDGQDGLNGETINGGRGGADECASDPGDNVSNCEIL